MYEAMSCGRDVIIYDNRGYSSNYADGLLTEKSFDSALKSNFSGRAYKYDFSVRNLKEAIKKFGKGEACFVIESQKTTPMQYPALWPRSCRTTCPSSMLKTSRETP